MKKQFIQPELLGPMVADAFGKAGERADANDTLLVAQALTQTAVKTVGTIYPGLMARRLAPVIPIDPGADTFTWHRLDRQGAAKFIENFTDDLPRVEAYATEMTGKVKSVGSSFAYSTQDIRRMAMAARSGRQYVGDVVQVNKISIADEMVERKKDSVFALGDTTFNLPGMLNDTNINQVDAQTAAGGTNTRPWDGVDKTPVEILEDMLVMYRTPYDQSKGNFTANKMVLPIEHRSLIATTVLNSNGNFETILERFLKTVGWSPDQVIGWDKAHTADGGSADRAMCGYFDANTIGLIDPLGTTAQAPQAKNLAYEVPVEGRVGGCLILQPLAFAYMDNI